jgi:hypothetical protein
MRLAREEPLSGGSYLSHFYPSERDWRRKTNGVRVGVIDYRLDGVPDAEPIYRLVTTILDHNKAPAVELAALYHERWEIETALDELKTHLRGAKIVLRSRTPDLVRQEFYGLIVAHFAIRGLMHEATLKADDDPDQLSLIHAVRASSAPERSGSSPRVWGTREPLIWRILTWINRGLERADEIIVLAAELLLKAELEKQKADDATD